MEVVGRKALQRELPEWALYWINLKGLRQILRKSAAVVPPVRRARGNSVASVDDDEASSSSDEDDLVSPAEWLVSGYLMRLRSEVAKVQAFYNHKREWFRNHDSHLSQVVETLAASVADPEGDGGWGADGFVPSPAPAVPVAPTINWSGNKPSHARKTGTGHEAGGAPAIGRPHHKPEEYADFMSPSLNTAMRHDEGMDDSRRRYRFLVVKKALKDFKRELYALKDYLRFNHSCVVHALKFLEKRTGQGFKENFLATQRIDLQFLDASEVKSTLEHVRDMLAHLETLAPTRSDHYYTTKVYTVGCFDLFHRGHINLFKALREYGHFIVAGIHDDRSYELLKHKAPVHSLAKRMANVRPHVDMLFVIPDTDPTAFLQAMVSQQDIDGRNACYVRGEDMEAFPGREWVETVMPIHFLPRSMGVSSTLVRSLYNGDPRAVFTTVQEGSGDHIGPLLPPDELIQGVVRRDTSSTGAGPPGLGRTVSTPVRGARLARRAFTPVPVVRTAGRVDASVDQDAGELAPPAPQAWMKGVHASRAGYGGGTGGSSSSSGASGGGGGGGGIGGVGRSEPLPPRRTMTRSMSTPHSLASMATNSQARPASPPPAQRRGARTPNVPMQRVRPPAGVSDLAPLLRQLSNQHAGPNSPVSVLGVTDEDLAAQRARLRGKSPAPGASRRVPSSARRISIGSGRTGPPEVVRQATVHHDDVVGDAYATPAHGSAPVRLGRHLTSTEPRIGARQIERAMFSSGNARSDFRPPHHQPPSTKVGRAQQYSSSPPPRSSIGARRLRQRGR